MKLIISLIILLSIMGKSFAQPGETLSEKIRSHSNLIVQVITSEDFFACSVCKINNGTIQRSEINRSEDIKVHTILIESENDEVVRNLQITGVPTTIFFKDSKIVARAEGFLIEEQFEKTVMDTYGINLTDLQELARSEERAKAERIKKLEEKRRLKEEIMNNRIKYEDEAIQFMWNLTSDLQKNCDESTKLFEIDPTDAKILCRSNDPIKAFSCYTHSKRKAVEGDIAISCSEGLERPTFECVDNRERRVVLKHSRNITFLGMRSRWNTDTKYGKVNEVISKRCESEDSFLYGLNL